jgi:hypothetical protein
MANFVVDPALFIPDGFEVEDWAHPARGRIIISGNPPRRHDEYAIVTMHPHPPANQLYNALDDVVDEYFEENHNVRVVSRCLSLLGLCLIQFHSAIGRQAMINLSPHHIDENRAVTVVEHDRGINLRNSFFTRTCWVL